MNIFKTLFQKYSDSRSIIKTEYFNNAIQSLNALFNSTFDDYSPGHSTSGNPFLYGGHNHQVAPMTRGCIYSEAGGNIPLWQVDFTKAANGTMVRKILNASQYDSQYRYNTTAARADYISKHYASRKINGDFLEGRMACSVSGSDFVVYFGENLPNRGAMNQGIVRKNEQPYSIKVNQNSSEGFDFITWYDFKCPFKDGTWNGLPEIFVLNTANETCSFKMYAIIIDEVPGVSHIRNGQTGWAL